MAPVDDNLDTRPEVLDLWNNLRRALPALETLLDSQSGAWGYEDALYRFYHQSFKVYAAPQAATDEIVRSLSALAPDRPLHPWFLQIVCEGTQNTWEPSHNQQWLEKTRPIIEAYLHARYFLEMAVRYARALEAPPNFMPTGWASLLYLYGLR